MDLTQVHSTYSSQLTSLTTENASLKESLRISHRKVVEVESFLESDTGRCYNRLEGVLAETKLRLALAQAERDELELRWGPASRRPYLKAEEEAGNGARRALATVYRGAHNPTF